MRSEHPLHIIFPAIYDDASWSATRSILTGIRHTLSGRLRLFWPFRLIYLYLSVRDLPVSSLPSLARVV
jgi:hypothetical protein